MLERAYALLTCSTSDEPEAYVIRGIATTPEPDRRGDIIEPLGLTFRNPIPLLLHHDPEKPIGMALLDPPTQTGVTFTATLARLAAAGVVKSRIEEARHLVEARLVRAVSVGLKPKPGGVEWLKDGGRRITRAEIVELSLVTIPANAQATIAAAIAADRAVSGAHLPGAPGAIVVYATRGAPMPPTVKEQISSFENTRAAKVAELTAIMAAAAAEGATLDEVQTERYDGLALEVKNIDDHLPRLRALEQTMQLQAVPVAGVTDTRTAAAVRGGTNIVQVKANVPKGTSFTRYCQALLVGNGSKADAITFAERWNDSTPEVALILKAAVAAGTTTDATWAGPLVQLKPITDEFLELLRPATLLGRIPGLRQVPFNVSIASQTGGGTYQWVGQNAPKPVTKLQFGSITLGFSKCSGIIVITEELARMSTPSAEETIRRDMINGIAQFLDVEFTDPAKAPVANVSPGSITNGVTPITSAGTSAQNARTDIQALAAAMVAAGIPPAGAVLLISETNALALAGSLNALSQPLFPGLSVTGGSVMGFQAIASQSVASNVILVQPDAILYADDGGVTIDVSREASVQMDSAPMNPPDATVVLTSLWQNNLVGLRAERWINWKRARTGSVQYTVQTYAA